jgi:hypothetical protein
LLSGLSGRSIALRNSLELMERIRHRASAHFIAAEVPHNGVRHEMKHAHAAPQPRILSRQDHRPRRPLARDAGDGSCDLRRRSRSAPLAIATATSRHTAPFLASRSCATPKGGHVSVRRRPGTPDSTVASMPAVTGTRLFTTLRVCPETSVRITKFSEHKPN